MKLSNAGKKKLTQLEADKLIAYKDEGGVWTIGRGWTGKVRGQPIRKGTKITQAESDELFNKGLFPYEMAVSKSLQPGAPQNVFEALTFLCWNIGIGGYNKSSAAKYARTVTNWTGGEAIKQLGTLMKRYNKVRKKGGQLVTSQGLVNRRNQEVAWMQGKSKAPATKIEKVVAGVGAAGGAVVAAEQTGVVDENTVQTVIDSAGLFGMSGSTLLATIGSVVIVGAMGYLIYSKFKSRRETKEPVLVDDIGTE